MENTDISYKLEVDYHNTIDYLLFTTNGIIVPKFLSFPVIGRNKPFFLNNKLLTCLDNSYVLNFDTISEVNNNKNLNQTNEIKFIGKLDSKNHIIIKLSKINEKRFLKIYEIIEKKSHIDVPSLKDIEADLNVVIEGRLVKFFTVMALTAISSFLLSFELIGDIPESYGYLSYIILGFSACFFLYLILGLLWYSSKNIETQKKKFKQITLILIISEILFLIIIGFAFLFGFTR